MQYRLALTSWKGKQDATVSRYCGSLTTLIAVRVAVVVHEGRDKEFVTWSHCERT